MEKVLNSFGTYNIRVRLTSIILFLCPFIIEIYFLFPEARELSTTVVVILIFYAICNVATILCRESGTKAMKKCFPHLLPAQQMLMPSDNYLDSLTKARYYAFFENNIDGFKASTDDEKMEDMVQTAVTWLISKTRNSAEFSLISEENINFGLAYNLLALKTKALLICVMCFVLNIYILTHTNISMFSIPTIILCLVLDGIIFLFWLFIINESLVKELGKKYARVLLSACDTISN